MSRCSCRKEMDYKPMFMPKADNNCCCSFPTLIILILIVLQFSKKDKCYGDDYKDCGCEKNGLVDNGILFIIALFYLACCGAGCGKGFGAF